MGFGKEEKGKGSSDEMVIYMGKGVEIKGEVFFEGTGRIDGKVEGKIQVKGSLILGEGAEVSSEIIGETIIVGGRVKGRITALKKVQLLKTSFVSSDINTPSLVIEEGAQFNGASKMGSDLKAATPAVRQPQEKVVPAKEQMNPVMKAVK